MKLWEALRAMEENPEKEFECGGMRLIRGLGAYRFTNVITEERAFYMNAHNDWQEVKQPVTWMEALGAWALEGKTVRCVIGYSDYIFDGSSNHLEDVLGSMTRKQIKEGTWYIEEETK